MTREVLVPHRPSLVTRDGNNITSETDYSFNQFATIDDNFVNDETSGGESIVNNKILRDLDTDDTGNYDDRFINFKNKGVNNSESTFIDDNGTVKIQIDFSNNFGKIKRFTQFGDISVNEIKKNVPQKIINKQLYNIDYGKNQFEKFTDPYNTLIGVLNFVLNFLNISTSGIFITAYYRINRSELQISRALIVFSLPSIMIQSDSFKKDF